jgi:hypothetical protein
VLDHPELAGLGDPVADDFVDDVDHPSRVACGIPGSRGC